MCRALLWLSFLSSAVSGQDFTRNSVFHAFQPTSASILTTDSSSVLKELGVDLAKEGKTTLEFERELQ